MPLTLWTLLILIHLNSESTYAFTVKIMTAISPGPSPDIKPISLMMVEKCWLSSASHLSMFHWTCTSVPAWSICPVQIGGCVWLFWIEIPFSYSSLAFRTFLLLYIFYFETFCCEFSDSLTSSYVSLKRTSHFLCTVSNLRLSWLGKRFCHVLSFVVMFSGSFSGFLLCF